jgi:hypothetical protein
MFVLRRKKGVITLTTHTHTQESRKHSGQKLFKTSDNMKPQKYHVDN